MTVNSAEMEERGIEANGKVQWLTNNGKDGRQNSSQNNSRLLFPCYQSVLFRLKKVLNHSMNDFIQFSINCCPVKSTQQTTVLQT